MEEEKDQEALRLTDEIANRGNKTLLQCCALRASLPDPHEFTISVP